QGGTGPRGPRLRRRRPRGRRAAEAVAVTGQPALDRITLRGLLARGFHGVIAAERELGQEFSADVVRHVATREAAAGDDLTATVNYAEVAKDVVAVLAGPPLDLIETVAARIAEQALRRPR